MFLGAQWATGRLYAVHNVDKFSCFFFSTISVLWPMINGVFMHWSSNNPLI